VISIHARLYKFETKLTLPRWQEKMMTCRIALQQSSTLPGLGASEFELYIEEEVETSDTQCQIRFPISDIAAVGSSTLHVLGLGEHELEAVLLVDSVASTASRQLGFPLTLMPQHWCQPQIAHLIIHKQILKVLLSGF
jgi:hypothetical protein